MLGSPPTEKRLQRDLEVVVLGAVDERVDAAVREDGDDGKVIERATEVCGIADKIEEDENLIPGPTEYETYGHRYEGLHHVALGLREVVHLLLLWRLLLLLLLLLVSALAGRMDLDAALDGEDDPGVADDEHDERDEVLDGSSRDPNDASRQRARPDGEGQTLTVDDPTARPVPGEVVQRAEDPREDDHSDQFVLGEVVLVEYRVDDTEISATSKRTASRV